MKNDGTTFEEEYRNFKIYYTQDLLQKFEIFYNTYKPYEYIGDRDIYYTDDVKEQFDKIVNGDLYVDVEFQTPDSPIRDYMNLYYFDKNRIDRYKKVK